jgi:histidinol phosphatase-like enzyme (inositol monophosphatase family)
VTAARELDQRLTFAIQIAREAGALTRRLFLTQDLAVAHKGDGSPVTAADRGAERLLRERIAGRYPEDGILGEEEGESRGASGRTWILDPIDGTVAFVAGVPLYGTMVGLEEDGEPTLGVIVLPALDELVAAGRGLGARWVRSDGSSYAARVSATAKLADALLCATSVRLFLEAGLSEAHARLVRAVGRDRGWSDCYAFVLLATGRCDAVVEPAMQVWDCAAAAAIVAEAGGSWSDLDGRRTLRGGTFVASNGRLHEALLRVVRG